MPPNRAAAEVNSTSDLALTVPECFLTSTISSNFAGPKDSRSQLSGALFCLRMQKPRGIEAVPIKKNFSRNFPCAYFAFVFWTTLFLINKFVLLQSAHRANEVDAKL